MDDMPVAGMARLLRIAKRGDAALLLDALGIELLDAGQAPSAEQLRELLVSYFRGVEVRS